MSNGSFKVKKSLNIEPTASPTLTEQGDIAYDSTTDRVKVRGASTTDTVVEETKTQTISGKTFAQNILPDANNTRDLGSSGTKFKDGHFQGAVSVGSITTTGDMTIGGDLTVNGTTTTLNTATLDVEDKNISVNKGGTSAGAAGSGFTVLGDSNAAIAAIKYDSTLASKFNIGATGSESEIMSTTATQTISNKSFDQHIIPVGDGTYDLGSSAASFNDAYIDGDITSETELTIRRDGGGTFTIAPSSTIAENTAVYAPTGGSFNFQFPSDSPGIGMKPIVTAAASQTLTNKTLSGNTASNLINGSGTFNFNSSGTLTAPNATDTLVGKATSDTLSNKLLNATNSRFIDGTDNSKRAEFNLAGISASTTRVIAIPDDSSTMVLTATSQTLTNKTIDADNNTITNIENADIKAAAAIDATKIADGSVTNTEFQYLGALGSAAVGVSDTQVLSNKDLVDGTSTEIVNSVDNTKKLRFSTAGSTTGISTTLSTTSTVARDIALPDATTTLVGTDTSQVLTNKTLSGNLSTGFTTGSGVVTFNSSGTVTLPSATDTLVGKATTDTLTNKTLASGSTIISGGVARNITFDVVNAGNNSTTTFVPNTSASTTVGLQLPNANTTLVGTDVAQTLTNKTFDDAVTHKAVTTPSNPAASYYKVYFKSDGKLYKLSPAGVETEIGSGGGGISSWAASTAYTAGETVKYDNKLFVAQASFTSGATFQADFTTGYWVPVEDNAKRNLALTSFRTGVSGWEAKSATLTNNFPSGALSAPGSTVNVSTLSRGAPYATNALRAEWLSSGAAAGNMLISPAYKLPPGSPRVRTFSFDYEASGGTFSASSTSTYGVALYDVTNSKWVQPAGVFNFPGTYAKSVGTFQLDSNCTSFRKAIYLANSVTSGSIIDIWNVDVSEQSVAYGAPISDWQTYTPTFTNLSATNKEFWWRRVGDTLEIKGAFEPSSITGTINISIPSGMAMDASKLEGANGSTNTYTRIGTADAHDNVTGAHIGVCVQSSSSTSNFYIVGDDGLDAWNATTPFTFGASDEIHVRVSVPIAGWSSNVLMSAETDTRVVAFYGSNTAGTTIAAETDIPFTTAYDTHSAFSGSTFTAPVSGYYRITINLWVAAVSLSTSQELDIYISKNGAASETLQALRGNGVSHARSIAGTRTYYLNTGETLKARASSDVSTTLLTNAGRNFMTVERLSGPATIAASEKVKARYTSSAGQSIANGSVVIVDYGTKVYDTHGAVTTGGSWKFTAPRPGYYKVNARAFYANASFSASGDYMSLQLWKGGSSYSNLDHEMSEVATTRRVSLGGDSTVYLNTGEYIDVRTEHLETTARSLSTSTASTYIEIESD